MKHFLTLIIVASFPVISLGASFDCTKAGTDVERTICYVSELSDLDSQLGDIYRQIRKDKSVVNFEEIRAEQRSWIKERNSCSHPDCLRAKYQERLLQLCRIKSISPFCSASEANTAAAGSKEHPEYQPIVGSQDSPQSATPEQKNVENSSLKVQSINSKGSLQAKGYEPKLLERVAPSGGEFPTWANNWLREFYRLVRPVTASCSYLESSRDNDKRYIYGDIVEAASINIGNESPESIGRSGPEALQSAWHILGNFKETSPRKIKAKIAAPIFSSESGEQCGDDVVSLLSFLTNSLDGVTAQLLSRSLRGDISEFDRNKEQIAYREQMALEIQKEAAFRETIEGKTKTLGEVFHNYLMINKCYEDRIGYAAVFINETEHEETKQSLRAYVGIFKEHNRSIDVNDVWRGTADKFSSDFGNTTFKFPDFKFFCDASMSSFQAEMPVRAIEKPF